MLRNDEILDLARQVQSIRDRAVDVHLSWAKVPDVASAKLANPITGKLINALDSARIGLQNLSDAMQPVLNSDRVP